MRPAKRPRVVRPVHMAGLEIDVLREVGREQSFDIEQPCVWAVFPDLPRTPTGCPPGSYSAERRDFLQSIDRKTYDVAIAKGPVHRGRLLD